MCSILLLEVALFMSLSGDHLNIFLAFFFWYLCSSFLWIETFQPRGKHAKTQEILNEDP